jgi:hypothetical protein
MKFHYQNYRPHVVKALTGEDHQQNEGIFLDQLVTGVSEYYGTLGMSLENEVGEALALVACAKMERQWMMQGKNETIFIEPGMVSFLQKISIENMSLKEIGLPSKPYAISWHPSERIMGMQIPVTLVGSQELSLLEESVDDGMSILFKHPTKRGHSSQWISEWSKITSDSETVDMWDDVMTKLVFKLHVYMRAFPQLVRNGIPYDIKERCLRQMDCDKFTVITLHPRAKASPGAHFRSGHFRCLRDERFKRDAYGRPVILLIEPTTVGEMSARTVKTAEEGVA